MRYTYSRWSGSGGSERLDPDAVLDALADELLADGDLDAALRRAVRWGIGGDEEEGLEGIQSLLQRLRSERQNDLGRYDLDTVLGDIEEQLSQILAAERRGIEQRREQLSAVSGPMQAAVEAVMDRKSAFLDGLPSGTAAAVMRLAEHDFLDDSARVQFDALLETLQRHVLQQHAQRVEQSIGGVSAADVAALTDALRDLNEMLAAQERGSEPDFGDFMQSHGDQFPGARSLDDLVEALQAQASHTEALFGSMTAGMRGELEGLLRSVLGNVGLRHEMERLAQFLEDRAPRKERRDYPFSGEETVTLGEALDLMRRMHDFDALERALEGAHASGDTADVDASQVRALLGDGAGSAFERLDGLWRGLEDAGYIACRDGAYDLTARGIRRIGEKALREIFRHLRSDVFGDHALPRAGHGGDRSELTKPYQFGDPFLLDAHGTLMNAVRRTGFRGRPKLTVDDFDVFRQDATGGASTVLMVDLSRSMPVRGCFVAAKKVALALSTLIRMQYPWDRLYVVAFSDYARQIQPEELHGLIWGNRVYGTNMHHGFLLARHLLSRHARGSKQIILITDGEPTAHCEGNDVKFAYPPTSRTFQETLREAKRCTQEGIVINTFMLARSPYLTDFVKQLTRINRGRAFFATPERLGEYVVIDYMTSRGSAAP